MSKNWTFDVSEQCFDDSEQFFDNSEQHFDYISCKLGQKLSAMNTNTYLWHSDSKAVLDAEYSED